MNIWVYGGCKYETAQFCVSTVSTSWKVGWHIVYIGWKCKSKQQKKKEFFFKAIPVSYYGQQLSFFFKRNSIEVILKMHAYHHNHVNNFLQLYEYFKQNWYTLPICTENKIMLSLILPHKTRCMSVIKTFNNQSSERPVRRIHLKQ